MTCVFIEALGIDRPGGGRTGILNTIRALPQVVPDIYWIVYLSRPESDLDGIPQIEQHVVQAHNRFLARLKLQWLLPMEARRRRAALIHFTKNLMTDLMPCARVVTVHDLTTLRYPETQNLIDVAYWRWIEPAHLRRADSIIAVSADTAHDMAALYGIPERRIHVVSWAPDDRFMQPVAPDVVRQVRVKYNLPDRYVLFVGILAKKKNLRTLIRSMAYLRDSGIKHHLIIAGRRYSQSDASDDLSLIATLGLADVIHYIGEVPDEDLPALYAASDVYVLPSLHEGFGIPCWEAMAVGVPVIASNRGALPGVVGDAGLLIDDPLDMRAWADAIHRLVTDQAVRTELIEKGRRQVAGRTWRTVAAETYAIYRSILEPRHLTRRGER